MTTQDATALLDLRAALLDGGPSAELEATTEALRERLEASEPIVRRVRRDEPGDLVERLATAEVVHPIADDQDLADRLDDDRRCFVLEHPALPGRPMNVVWVALWDGTAGDVSAILDPAAPTGDATAADTAVFYSIWSAEPGLVGFAGGFPLLTGTIAALRAELPQLQTFVTLSPIPGFRSWWTERNGDGADPEPGTAGGAALVADCLAYLTELDEGGRPIDPVARFHLGNGARLVGLHRDGDPSERGAERSFGIMANYRYEPEDLDANRRSLTAGRVALGPEIEPLVDPGPEPGSR